MLFRQWKIVILLNGFQKKSQKTSKGEIEKAERLKYKYYEERKN
nr:type II toxin-antitoxin system RelE/ParE family toxin [Algoriphagus antarcticus]